MYVFVSYSKDKDARDREGHRKRGRINVFEEYVYTYTYTTDIIYIYIYHYRPRFHAWELSKQASKQTFVCRRRICTKGSPCFTRVSFPSFRSVLFSSPLFHVDRRRFARRSDPRAISTPVSWLFPFVFRLFTFLNFISIFPLSSI